MAADRCDFEHEGHCMPPKEYQGFRCPSATPDEIGLRCDGKNEDLVTEEEYESTQPKWYESEIVVSVVFGLLGFLGVFALAFVLLKEVIEILQGEKK